MYGLIVAFVLAVLVGCGDGGETEVDLGIYVESNEVFSSATLFDAAEFLQPVGFNAHKASYDEARIWVRMDYGPCPYNPLRPEKGGHWAGADFYGGITIWANCYGDGPEYVIQSDDLLAIINVLVHELCHTIGMDHVTAECEDLNEATGMKDELGNLICGPAVMNPGSISRFPALQDNDLRAFFVRRHNTRFPRD